MGISNLNKGTKFSFQYDGKSIEYLKTEDFVKRFGCDKVFILRACHINRGGRYGDSATMIVTESTNSPAIGINAPSHMVDLITEILNSKDYIDDIDNQRAGVQAYSYTDRDGVTRHSFKFVDI